MIHPEHRRLAGSGEPAVSNSKTMVGDNAEENEEGLSGYIELVYADGMRIYKPAATFEEEIDMFDPNVEDAYEIAHDVLDTPGVAGISPEGLRLIRHIDSLPNPMNNNSFVLD